MTKHLHVHRHLHRDLHRLMPIASASHRALESSLSTISKRAQSTFLKLVGAIFKASRYLATVLRAQSMPCSLSISES